MFTQAAKQNENGKAAAEQKKVQQKEQNGLTLSRHQSPFPGSIQRKKSPANGNWSIASRSSFPGQMQAKVKIGEPNDKFEKEADAMADKVMSMPAKTQAIATGEKPGAVSRKPETSLLSKITPLTQKKEEEVQNKEEEEVQEKAQTSIQTKSVDGAAETPPSTAQRMCSDCSANEGVQSMLQPMADEAQTQTLQSQIDSASMPNIQAESSSETSRGPPDSFESSLNSSKGGGSPLPDETQREMGSGFGADFSNVRVHTDSNAVRMNQQIGAQAFTYGRDIYFNEGKYSPGTDTGKHLLAHELTHTVQQGAVVRPYRVQMHPEATGPIVQRAGPDPLAVDKEEIDKDKGVEKAVQARAPPGLHTAPLMVQGGWLGDKLNEYASDIPGWTLITVVVGYNPLTERDVERTPKNFLKGLMGLVPGGNALYEKLEEHNLITEAFNWLNQQLSDLDLSWRRVAREMEEAWDEMSIRYSFSTNLGIVKDHLYSIYRDVKEFGKRIINKTIELVKQAILIPLGEYIRDNTRAWPLVTVLLGEDPITGEKVERNLYNIASGFLMLDPDGEAYLNKLNESGKLLELSDWFDAEVEKLNVNADTITQVFSDAWDLITLDNLLEPLDTFKKIFDLFFGPFERIINFVIAVAMKILTAIKDWLIAQLKEHAHNIPGYPLLTVILGKDPLTGEAVPRTPQNFIKGFMSFVPDGLDKYKNLEESGAIDKAFAWLEDAIKKLGLIGEALINAFIELWTSFTINDLLTPIATFERVVAIFTQPVTMIIDFAIEVGMKVLEFIFIGVLGERGARVLAIFKKAQSTFTTIIKNPIGFLSNLLNALKKGFKQFSGNILTHLKNGLVGWLLGALEGAGLELPESFDFKGIFSLVMQVLGLTWPQLRPKFVKHLGERVVGAAESSFDWIMLIKERGFAGVWERILEKVGEWIDGLKQKVMEGIRDWVITKIIESAITKLATMWNPAGAVIQSIITMYNTIQFFLERFDQIVTLVETVVESISKIASGNIADAANWVEQAMARTIPVMISFLARLIGLGGISTTIKNLISKVQDWVGEKVDKLIGWIVKKVKEMFKPKNRDQQSDEQRAENKRNAIREINAKLATGIKIGELNGYLAGIKEKYQLLSVTVGDGYDIQVQNSAVVTISAEPDLSEQDINQPMGRTADGQLTNQPIDNQTNSQFTVGEFNSRVDNPKTIYGLLVDGLAQSGTNVTVDGLEYNNFISRMEVNPARPLLVSAKVYGYAQSFFADARRSGISANVAKMGNIERSYRDAKYREQAMFYNGGHLVGHVFGGPDSYENLTPMKNSFNTGAYAKFENFMRDKVKVDNPSQLDSTKSYMEFDIMPNYEPAFSFTGSQLLDTLDRGLVTEIESAEHALEVYRNKRDFLQDFLGQSPTRQQEIRDLVANNIDRANELRDKLTGYLALYHLLRNSSAQSIANNLTPEKSANSRASTIISRTNSAVTVLNTVVPEAGEFESIYSGWRTELQSIIAEEAEDTAAVESSTITSETKTTNDDSRRQRVTAIGTAFYDKVKEDKGLNKKTREDIGELRGITSIPSSLEAVQEKVNGYATKIDGLQEVVNEASASNNRNNIAPLRTSPFNNYSFTAESRIPTSFTVNLEYAAKYGSGNNPSATSEQQEFESRVTPSDNKPGQTSNVGITAETRLIAESGSAQAAAQQAEQQSVSTQNQNSNQSTQPQTTNGNTTPPTDQTFNLTFDIAQAKLVSPTSSWKSDPAEQQADSMADRIVTGNISTPLASSITPTSGKIHKKCATCEQEEKSDAGSFESQLSSASGGGRKLDKNTQTEMESGFGADFSGVRVHTGQNAAQMSQSIGARAFTHGNDIYFNSGQYNPESREGKHLLAHELSHTVQQGAAKPKVQAQRGPPNRGSPCTQCNIQAKEQGTGSAVQSRAGPVEVRESTSPDAVQRWSFGGLVRGAGRLVSSGVRAVGNAASAVAEGVMDMGRDALFAIIRRVAPDFLPLIQGGGITSFIRRLLNSAFSTLTNGFMQSLSAANAMGASIQERFAGAVATFTEIIGQLRNNDCSGVFALGSSIGSFFSSTLQPVFTAIRSIAEPIKNVFDSMFEVVAAPVMDFLRTIGGAAWESITGFISTIGDMFRSVKGALGSAWTRVKGWLGIEADEGTGEGGGLWEWVKEKATEVWNSITSALEPVMGPLRVVGGILLILSPAGPAILLWQAWPHLRDAWNWLSEMWGNLDLIGRSHQLLTQSILPPIMSALNTVGGALQSAAGWLGGILNRALSGVQQLMNALGSGGIFGFIRRAINVIVSKFESLVNGFNQFIQTAVTKAVELFNAAVAFLRPIFNVLVRIAAVVLNPFGISGLLLGGLWYLTPDCLKGPLINFLLDIMIGFLEILPPLPMLGILWPFVKTLTLGYLRRMREFDTERKVRLTNKIALIIAGQSPSFFLGFLLGIAMGVWEGVTGPFMMIADLFQLPGLIMGFVRQIQEYLGGLWEEAGELLSAAQENASTTVQSIIDGARDLLSDPMKIVDLISTAIQTALGAVESLGRSAADQVIGIFEQDDSALGQALGSLIGQMLFDAVVSFFTAGGAAAGAAAARVTRILQQFARRIMPIVRRLMQFFPRITSFIQRLIGMFRRVGSAVGRMLERFDSFIERIEDRFRGLLRRGDDIDLPNRRHAPDLDGPDLPNRRRSPDLDGPDVDAPSHRRRPDTDVDAPDRPRDRTPDSDVDTPDRHRDRSPDADTDTPDRRRNQDNDTDTDRPADHNDADERRRRRDEDDDDDPGWLEIRTAIRTAVVRFELSGGSRREIDTALDGAQRRYPQSRITVRPDLNDPYWVISAMHPTLHVPRTAEEVLLDRDTRWRMGGIEVRTRMSRLTEAQKNVAAINAILTPIKREYHYSRLHAENDQREGDINIMGAMSPEQQITEVEGSLDGKWREYETMFRREISEVGNDGASEEEIRGKIRTVENREEFNPLNISTTYRDSGHNAKRTISTMSPEKATYRESAEIWQSQTERKNAAQSFFNSEKISVTNSQYTNTHMNSIARSIETRFNFNRVNVNHSPHPTDSWTFIIQTPAHTLGEIEDVRGLHRGTEDDPIPILWYKPPSDYPSRIRTATTSFSRGSTRTLPLRDLRNNTLIEDIRIGFNTSNIVQVGDKVTKRTNASRSGVKQDRYRRVLAQHGYNMTARVEDADHVLDLGFEGGDEYDNMWPLNSGINRQGFNSFPWVRIAKLDRNGKAEERQMMRMSHKTFKIIGHGINRGLVGRDPV